MILWTLALYIGIQQVEAVLLLDQEERMHAGRQRALRRGGLRPEQVTLEAAYVALYGGADAEGET